MKATICLALTLTVTLVAALALAAAAAEKKTDKADIWSDKFIYHWDTNLWEFIGNCRVEIKGPDKATMKAPKLRGKLTKRGTQLEQITASGPVQFDVLTRKDAEGVQRKIVASCDRDAVYDAGARTVTLTGGAVAEMTTIPQQGDAGPTRFTADRLIINLKTLQVEGDNVHIEAEIPVESEESAAPAPGSP